MRIILVSGFMDSGKTTLIRHLAGYLVGQKGQRAVIIEMRSGKSGPATCFSIAKAFRSRGSAEVASAVC